MDAFTVLLKHLKISLDECSIRDASVETLVRFIRCVSFSEVINIGIQLEYNIYIHMGKFLLLEYISLSIYTYLLRQNVVLKYANTV